MARSRSSDRGSSSALQVVEGEIAAKQHTVSDDEGDYNLKILQPLFGYVRAKLGEDTLAEIVEYCGLPPEALLRNAGWISHEAFESLLASIRGLVGSDEEFVRACAYELKKQYGPFLLILRCMSVRSTYELMAKTGHMVCKVGSFATHGQARNSIRITYATKCDESRLNCLSRQGQLASLPTIFLGMAPAKLEEHSCVARGDERCEYELSWYSPLRLRLLILGAATGLLAAIGMPETLMHPVVAYASLPLLGGMTGGMLELRRVLAEHQRFTDQTTLEMEKVLHDHAQATDELSSLRERERDWNRHLEEGVEARTRKLNAVIDRLKSALRHRSGTYTSMDDAEADRPPRLSVMEQAVERVSRLVGELVSIASDTSKSDLKAEVVSVDELVSQIRRQLKATMIGANVRITVFQTREAPAQVVTVRPVLYRVIDNLLFNACRHTERGSITVEAGGTPGSLLLKVSDTGTGISKERLEQVFEHNDLSASTDSDRSGLPYAARLLDQIDGRLEIMSEPEVGTTLWVYVPVQPAVSSEETDEAQRSNKIVTIRPNTRPGALDG